MLGRAISSTPSLPRALVTARRKSADQIRSVVDRARPSAKLHIDGGFARLPDAVCDLADLFNRLSADVAIERSERSFQLKPFGNDVWIVAANDLPDGHHHRLQAVGRTGNEQVQRIDELRRRGDWVAGLVRPAACPPQPWIRIRMSSQLAVNTRFANRRAQHDEMDPCGWPGWLALLRVRPRRSFPAPPWWFPPLVGRHRGC